MSEQTISAQEGALVRGANAVQTAKTNIDTHIKNVRNEVEQLRAYWQGLAATAYTTTVNAWEQKAQKINDVLTTLEDGLRGTETTQQALEQENKANMAALLGQVDG